VNKKRVAREFCFQYFFHLQLPIFREIKDELVSIENDTALVESINEFKETTNTLLENDLNSFVLNHIKSTLINYEKIEGILTDHLKNWKLNRISRVDNTVLLLAANELCFMQDNKKNIVINEAIEISKKYGNAESGSFINGILDNISKKYE
jgi:N utilization substance protein B